MMKSDIKERWVTALRSGEYKQTTGSLNNGRGYCCLGVLCELLKDESDLFNKYTDDGVLDNKSSFYGNEETSLNNYQLDFVDLQAEQMDKLISLNDNYGRTFKELAYYIEKDFDYSALTSIDHYGINYIEKNFD
jgi:hypothetical protein